MFASLRHAGFRPVYLGGFLFGSARWGLGFLAAYVANDLTGSPRAVQLTGAAMWLPLLFAGVIAGALADRIDRRALLVGTIAVLIPVVVALAVLDGTGRLRAWMLYPAMLVLGLAWVVDITSRRTLVLDIVGTRMIDNAMALEALSTAIGLASGVLAGGAIVEALGVGQAFLGVAVLLALAALFFLRGPSPPVGGSSGSPGAGAHDPGDTAPGDAAPGAGAHDPGDTAPGDAAPGDTAAGDAASGDAAPGDTAPDHSADSSGEIGVRAAIASRPLRSVLGVTVLANFFYFSHTPLVPVFAERLDVGPLGAGLLASAGGFGMMIAALGVAAIKPPRGPTYVVGAGVALVVVIGLAQAPGYALAVAAALGASTGFGLFAATQAVATMTSVAPALRGRAMGLLSMAIGALPIGMFSLGEVAERVGPSTGVTIYAGTGAVLLVVWVLRRPEVLAAGR